MRSIPFFLAAVPPLLILTLNICYATIHEGWQFITLSGMGAEYPASGFFHVFLSLGGMLYCLYSCIYWYIFKNAIRPYTRLAQLMNVFALVVGWVTGIALLWIPGYDWKHFLHYVFSVIYFVGFVP